MTHSSAKGEAAALLATSRLVDAGLVVLRPAIEALPFDIAVFHGGKLYRIQVKRAQKSRWVGRWEIPFRKITPSGHGQMVYQYNSTMVEYLCGVVMETADIYLFPLDKVQAKSVVFVNTGHATQVKGHTRLVDPEQYKNKLCLGADVITL